MMSSNFYSAEAAMAFWPTHNGEDKAAHLTGFVETQLYIAAAGSIAFSDSESLSGDSDGTR